MSKREITVEKFKNKFTDVIRHTKMEVVDIVIALEKMDPTKNLQYVPWLAKQLINNQFKFEDTARVKAVLENFDKLKPRLEKRDINQFSFYELDETIDKIVNPEIKEVLVTKTVKEEGAFPIIKGSKILYNGPFGQLASPQTASAAKQLGAGTKWCTTQASVFKDYTENSDLYVWRDRNGSKYQYQIFHDYANRIQFYDARDRVLNWAEQQKLEQHPVLGKVLKQQEEAFKDYLFKQQEKVAKERKAQHEHDRLYDMAKYVLDETGINVKHVKKINSYPGGMEGFCKDLLDKKWDLIKPQMALGPRSSQEFAMFVLKARWPEQEPLIAKHAVSWTMYSREILGTNNMTKAGRTQRDKMRKEALKAIGLKLTAKMKKLPQW